MVRTFLSVAFLAVAALAAGPGLTGGTVLAAETGGAWRGQNAAPRPLKLAVSKSTIIDFDEEIRDVLVSNPQIADAVVRTNRRLYLLGNKFGTTNVVVFGGNGRQIANYELQVQPDTATLEGLLRRLVPTGDIKVEAVAGTVVLSGSVRSPSDAMQALEVASRFVGAPVGGGTTGSTAAAGGGGSSASSTGDSLQVVNALTIRGKDQVMLKVTIAEVQRSVVKQLGIDLAAVATGGSFTTAFATSNPFAVNGSSGAGLVPYSSGTPTFSNVNGNNRFQATVQALEQNGLMRTLAEPTLTAISGEEATFLVGGEFPIPVSQQNGSITVEFKKYGIALSFVPVVLAEGRISVKVNTEVSEPTSEGSFSIGSSTSSSLNIQALRVRRADSTLEVPSGGTIVMAGLIRDDVRQSLAGVPGAMSLPILGALFRSRDYQRSQSELAIFVQPIVVQPVAPGKLIRPDQNFQASSDSAATFLGRLNRTYRSDGRSTAGAYHGQYGFIYE
ncbi:type II and III secretion system protein family protein [Prosthecodimorpha staleyi]|uniref:Type II and III secretion system protein family protein n=1 Tax=Prosthecodimorpha staleyi TaxID=2840188 RepID=A0A947D705_9HYPH|nr:type II and III secretion system protein family protein [Prosthecodimorpha staleyi]MBT9291279.1 type II and III secretion system protein family protein [Prosthecodimorpha staleyi]